MTTDEYAALRRGDRVVVTGTGREATVEASTGGKVYILPDDSTAVLHADPVGIESAP